MFEGIYLIQEREFIKTQENVYKIGKSNNLSERIKHYPKESKLLLIILCKNSGDIEKELIKLLTKKFKLCSNYGAEYFEGKIDKIINEIENLFKTTKSLFCRIKNSTTNKFNFNFIINDDNNDILTKIAYPININLKDNKVDEDADDDVEDSKEDENEEDNEEVDIDEEVEVDDEDDEDDEVDEEVDVEISDDDEDIKDNEYIVNNLQINNFGVVNFAQEFKNNNTIKHICKYCNYSSSRKENYDRHLKSNKHKKNYINNTINNNNINNDLDNNLIKENNKLAKENKDLMNKLINLLKEKKI
jgi:hypothetical protein